MPTSYEQMPAGGSERLFEGVRTLCERGFLKCSITPIVLEGQTEKLEVECEFAHAGILERLMESLRSTSASALPSEITATEVGSAIDEADLEEPGYPVDSR